MDSNLDPIRTDYVMQGVAQLLYPQVTSTREIQTAVVGTTWTRTGLLPPSSAFARNPLTRLIGKSGHNCVWTDGAVLGQGGRSLVDPGCRS